jgi:poly(3-hydroxybutyrate) depolymerase
MRALIAAGILHLATFAVPAAAQTSLPLSWPPTLDSKNPTTHSTDGRAIEYYVHGPRKEWGYPADAKWDVPASQENDSHAQNFNSFYLVAPKVPHDSAPLCVVLHSANRTAYDYLGYSSLYKPTDPPDAKTAAVTNSPDDFYALYLNSTNDEWWGWNQAHNSPNFAQNINVPSPAELRVLDTIEWIVTKYKIDRNRIYLCGMSMGGCGTLGIGLPHGDIFAAALAAAPAGTEYAAYRTDSFKSPGAAQPDPPVMTDFSSPVDSWSATQPALLLAAQTNHLPLVLSWGPFGHVGDIRLIGKYPLCAVALAFPWLEIRKNEAYPAFTHASTDQTSPWLNTPAKFDESGQINAWFRWKNIEDTPSRFAMQLWIAHPEISDHSLAMPDSATVDVTPRRLQQFKLDPSKTYTWQLSRDSKAIASGKIKPDATNRLTLPQLNLTTSPAELSIQAD